MKTPAFVPLFGFCKRPSTNPRPEASPLDLRAVYALLTGPALRELTARLRAAPAGSLIQKGIENGLPAITGAGVFLPHRADENLIRFSRCLLLEFDTVPDVAAARAALLADPVLMSALLLVFVSPRGGGLRVVLATFPSYGGWPTPHQPDITPVQAGRVLAENFLGWAIWIQEQHGLRARPHGRTLPHACPLGYDPAAWLAPGW
jgi:hypothetical protein